MIQETLKLSAGRLDGEVVAKILKTYKEVCGGLDALDLYPQEYYLSKIQADLQQRRISEWRFGSTLSPMSKLKFSIGDQSGEVKIFFDPNLPQREGNEQNQLIDGFNKSLKEQFEDKK